MDPRPTAQHFTLFQVALLHRQPRFASFPPVGSPFPETSHYVMASVDERLAALRQQLDEGRTLNIDAVKDDEREQRDSDELEAAVESTDAQPPHTSRNSSKWKRKVDQLEDLRNADQADGEDDDDRLRSMKRRSRAVKPLSEAKGGGRTQVNDVLEYGGAGSVDSKALDNMVAELHNVEKRRAKFRRRRTFDEDRSDITFINEGNRLFNRTLDRHFDKFESVKEIKDNLERGTAK